MTTNLDNITKAYQLGYELGLTGNKQLAQNPFTPARFNEYNAWFEGYGLAWHRWNIVDLAIAEIEALGE